MFAVGPVAHLFQLVCFVVDIYYVGYQYAPSKISHVIGDSMLFENDRLFDVCYSWHTMSVLHDQCTALSLPSLPHLLPVVQTRYAQLDTKTHISSSPAQTAM